MEENDKGIANLFKEAKNNCWRICKTFVPFVEVDAKDNKSSWMKLSYSSEFPQDGKKLETN